MLSLLVSSLHHAAISSFPASENALEKPISSQEPWVPSDTQASSTVKRPIVADAGEAAVTLPDAVVNIAPDDDTAEHDSPLKRATSLAAAMHRHHFSAAHFRAEKWNSLKHLVTQLCTTSSQHAAASCTLNVE